MKKFKLILSFFLFSFFICSFFSFNFVFANSISLDESLLLDTIPDLEVEEEIFMIVEQSPRFPGCEDMEGSKEEKESCAQKRMNEFIYENLEYPEEARKNGVEGQVVIPVSYTHLTLPTILLV